MTTPNTAQRAATEALHNAWDEWSDGCGHPGENRQAEIALTAVANDPEVREELYEAIDRAEMEWATPGAYVDAVLAYLRGE